MPEMPVQYLVHPFTNLGDCTGKVSAGGSYSPDPFTAITWSGKDGVTLTGAKECRKVRIDPSLLSDAEMLEDLIAAAFNDASNKVDAESKSRMGAATAGMPLPPGMKMPF